MARDFDLFVIGAGSGGVRASRVASSYGAKVAVAEESRVGGTCVIRGCIPKKLLVYGAHFHEDFEDAAAFGWTVGTPTFDWGRLIANKDKEIDRLNGIYLRLLSNANVKLYPSHAKFLDRHTLDVGGERVSAETILIATGGWPVKPNIPGADLAITSNEALHLPTQPKHVIVVGGGYIAVEFAGIFNGLGSKVVQLYRGEQILRGFDDDVRTTLAQEMRKKGIDLRVGTDIARIEKTGGRLRAHLKDGGTIDTDAVMYATGRAPNTAGLNLAAAGVKLNDKGAVIVDDWSRSSVENIYAVGDVTDRINLTPVALNEGLAFAQTLYGKRPRKMDHANVPSAVFSQPNVASVGLSEAAARKQGYALDIYKTSFRPLKHTLTGRDEKTMMKIVVDAQTERVLGLHMVGPEAGEIIQGLAVAVKMGATKRDLDATVGIHPTAAEEFVTMREKSVPTVAKAAE
ncbi:MAG: glutathione-disulfide reductase [Alphaproteobacteria bacterium]|nr:glutathione-disulfide reductase [Alphaproteobacteria bacterium]